MTGWPRAEKVVLDLIDRCQGTIAQVRFQLAALDEERGKLVVKEAEQLALLNELRGLLNAAGWAEPAQP